jgi:putative membrane protein
VTADTKGTASLGPPERLHPLFLVTGLGGVAKGIWGMLAASAWFATQGRWKLAIGFVLLMAAISFAGLLVRWLTLEYRVGADQIRIDTGFVHRKSRAIPFERIQDVDIVQGPLQRLLGLAQVRFETGGSAGGKEEGVLHTVSLDRAEALRARVRELRAPAPIEHAALPEEIREVVGPPLYAMDNRRLLVAGLFNFSLAVLAALFGLSQTVGDIIGFDPFSRRFWAHALSVSEPLRQLIVANAVLTALAGAVVLLLLGSATGIVRTVLRDYGFRIDRTAGGLRRRRGLLTLTDVTLPLKRAQAALVLTGPVRRAFGWFELKLQNLAQDERGAGDHVIAPLAREDEIEAVVGKLGWPIAPERSAWRRISRAYLIMFLVAMVPLALIAVAQAWFLPLLGLAALAIIVVAATVRILAWPRTRYALDGANLFVETGWWRQRRLILPIAKVQSADVTDNALSRLFGVATVRLGVAGGSGFSDHAVPALPRQTAIDLRRAILA